MVSKTPHLNACVTACGKTLVEAIKTVLMLILNDVLLVWCGVVANEL